MIVTANSQTQILSKSEFPDNLTRITARGIKLTGPEFMEQAQVAMRKPLSFIQNLPSWIMDDQESLESQPSDKLASQLEAMAMQAKRAQRIMDDMAAFDAIRYHVKSPQIFEPFSRLSHLIDELFPAGPGRFSIFGHVPKVNLDPFLFNVCFVELLENAVIHADDPDISVQVTLEAVGSDLRIVISDDGIGIPTADFQRVFQPFEKLSQARSVETTGLGLSKVVRSVGLLGGTIDIGTLNEGTGTTHVVTLPMGRV